MDHTRLWRSCQHSERLLAGLCGYLGVLKPAGQLPVQPDVQSTQQRFAHTASQSTPRLQPQHPRLRPRRSISLRSPIPPPEHPGNSQAHPQARILGACAQELELPQPILSLPIAQPIQARLNLSIVSPEPQM
jgi:hypothetical protein